MRYYKPILITVLLAGGVCLADPRYASLKITSEPDSAVVVLDGTLQGRAPATAQMIDPGKHQLVVFKNGFKTYDRVLTFECGRQLTGHIKLEPLPGQADSLRGEDIPAQDDDIDVIQKPVPVKQPRAALSDAYVETGSGGIVIFNLLVDETGSILIAEISGSNADQVFARDARTAVRQWKFKPALDRNGKPRKMWIRYVYGLSITEDRQKE